MRDYSYSYNQCGMWEILPDRLEFAMQRAKMNQSELARAVGLKQPSIGRLLSGETKTSRSLYSIARALNTTPEYLKGDIDHPFPITDDWYAERDAAYLEAKNATGNQIDKIDLVEVQEIDLKFGMGATELEIPVTSTVRHFSRDWLRQYTRADPEKVYFAQGIGDSMAPTIHDSDLLIIDTSEDHLRMADKIWAVAFCGQGMVKRLRQTRDGVQILSDNQLVPPETAHDGELHILGRVVGIVRKM